MERQQSRASVRMPFWQSRSLSRELAPYTEEFLSISISPICSALPSAVLPRLTINLFSGGKHAGQQVSIQDVLIIPMSPQTIDGALVSAFDIYQSAAELGLQKYGMRLLTADEGGLAPPCGPVSRCWIWRWNRSSEAGYVPGKDVFLGIDVAATHFYEGSTIQGSIQRFWIALE